MKVSYIFKGRCIGSNKIDYNDVVGVSFNGELFTIYFEDHMITIRFEFISSLKIGDFHEFDDLPLTFSV